MSIQISFPGEVRVKASFDGFEVITDQPEANGGNSRGPSPFDLFLVSLGTCAGFYALRFCQERNLETAGMSISLNTDRHAETRHLERVSLTLHLPSGFPEKYRGAIIRATSQCSVKKVLDSPPEISLKIA